VAHQRQKIDGLAMMHGFKGNEGRKGQIDTGSRTD